MLTQIIEKLLQNQAFVFIATADKDAKPNVVPKFLVQAEGRYLFLIDYVLGRTWQNIKVNPLATISFMDQETLHGYALRGPVTLVTEGPEYDKVINRSRERQLSIIVEQVVQGVSRAKRHRDFGFAVPEKGVVLKFKMEEVLEVAASGKLEKETI